MPRIRYQPSHFAPLLALLCVTACPLLGDDRFPNLFTIFGERGGVLGDYSDGPHFDFGSDPNAGEPERDVYRYSFVFRYTNGHLQVASTKQGKQNDTTLPKSYLAADFSTEPPRVVLVEKPNEFSQWRIDYKKSPADGIAYVANATSRQDVWLAWGSDVTVVKRDGRKTILREPVLIPRKEQLFSVRPFVADGK